MMRVAAVEVRVALYLSPLSAAFTLVVGPVGGNVARAVADRRREAAVPLRVIVPLGGEGRPGRCPPPASASDTEIGWSWN